MTYKNLTELSQAYGLGVLNKERDVVCVDNDSITLYETKAGKPTTLVVGVCQVTAPDDEYGEDSECVFSFDGCPNELLIEALELLGIPAEPA